MKKPMSKRQKHGLVERWEELWSPGLAAAGWVLVPFDILDLQGELGLSAKDLNIILHLLRHMAREGGPAELSKRALAAKMGVDPSTVQRGLASLEKRGLIRREARFDPHLGQKANRYHLDGLIRVAASVSRSARPEPRAPSRAAARPPDIDLVVGTRNR